MPHHRDGKRRRIADVRYVPAVRLRPWLLLSLALATGGLASFACDPFDGDEPGALGGAGAGRPGDEGVAGTDGGLLGDPEGITSTPDAEPSCDPDLRWGTPRPIPGDLSVSDANEGVPRLSADELTIVFESSREGGYRLWTSRRESRDAPFPAPTALSELNTAGANVHPTLSADGLRIVFASSRESDAGGFALRLFQASRTDPQGRFGKVTRIEALLADDHTTDTGYPYLTTDGSKLYFASNRDNDAGAYQGYSSQLADDGGFLSPVRENLGSPRTVLTAIVSADGRTLLVSSGHSTPALRAAVRASRDEPFPEPTVVQELNALPDGRKAHQTQPGWISPDGCRVYLTREIEAGSGYDLYMADRLR